MSIDLLNINDGNFLTNDKSNLGSPDVLIGYDTGPSTPLIARITNAFNGMRRWLSNSFSTSESQEPLIEEENGDIEQGDHPREDELEVRAQQIRNYGDKMAALYDKTLVVRYKDQDIRIFITTDNDGENTLYYIATKDDLSPGGIEVLGDKIINFLPQSLIESLQGKGKAVGNTLIFGGLGAISLASYALTDESIVTQAAVTSLTAFVVPKLASIPFVTPLLTPAVASLGAYFLSNAIDEKSGLRVMVQFAFVAGLGLCALVIKRAGKATATSGWAGLKPYIVPIGLTEGGLVNGIKSLAQRASRWIRCGGCRNEPSVDNSHFNDHRPIGAYQVQPFVPENEEYSIQCECIEDPISLALTSRDGDMFYQVIIGDKKYNPVRMASKADDDDDDDDDDVKDKKEDETLNANVKKAKKGKKEKVKKEKKEKVGLPNRMSAWKEGAFMGVSGLLTGVFQQFVDDGQQGLTTKAAATIFSASLKAKLRELPDEVGYGSLVLASGAVILVSLIPGPYTAFMGKFYYMPLLTLLSMFNKRVKDEWVNPKLSKSFLYRLKAVEEVNGAKWPLFMQKIWKKCFGWKPKPFEPAEHPLEFLLNEEYSGDFKLTFDAVAIHPANPSKDIKAVLKIAHSRISGVYKKMTQLEQQELHLARLKAKKIGSLGDAVFLGGSIALTVMATFATASYQHKIYGDLSKMVSKPGQGILTGILNSVPSAYLKQSGREIPLFWLDVMGTEIAVLAEVGEYCLIKSDMLFFSFAFIPTSALLGVLGKRSKALMYGKSWNKCKGWITPSWPKNWKDFKKTDFKEGISVTYEEISKGFPSFLLR